MKKVVIDSLDTEDTLFHFDVRDITFIEEYGFPADIGEDSKKAEKTPKVFFSKGAKGVLNIIDVWIIWRMNRDHYNSSDWDKEFLSGAYLEDDEKKEFTFDNMYDWLLKRRYYKVELLDGIDYKRNDIDEAKQSAIEDKIKREGTKLIPWKYLFTREMYKGKIEHDDAIMEEWNMHTISGQGITPNKITLIQTSDGRDDALSIIEELYQKYDNKDEFRVLNSFIEYCQKRRNASQSVIRKR